MTIAVVQTVSVVGNSVLSVTTAAIATTSGNLIIADNGWYNKTHARTFSDSMGLAWATAIAKFDGGNYCLAEFYNTSISGSASHTFTNSAATTDYPSVVITEVSGHDPTSTLDKTSSKTEGAGTSHTTNSTATTSQADELLHGAGYTDSFSSSTCTVSAPWVDGVVQINSVGTYPGVAVASRVVSATGTYAYPWATGSSVTILELISTWKSLAPSTAKLSLPSLGLGVHQQICLGFAR